MGMFDEVFLDCPECDGVIVYQSKCGPCTLQYNEIHNAPIMVQADVIDESQKGDLVCEHCGTAIEIPYQIMIGQPRVKKVDE